MASNPDRSSAAKKGWETRRRNGFRPKSQEGGTGGGSNWRSTFPPSEPRKNGVWDTLKDNAASALVSAENAATQGKRTLAGIGSEIVRQTNAAIASVQGTADQANRTIGTAKTTVGNAKVTGSGSGALAKMAQARQKNLRGGKDAAAVNSRITAAKNAADTVAYAALNPDKVAAAGAAKIKNTADQAVQVGRQKTDAAIRDVGVRVGREVADVQRRANTKRQAARVKGPGPGGRKMR